MTTKHLKHQPRPKIFWHSNAPPPSRGSRLGPTRLGRSAAIAQGPATWVQTADYIGERTTSIRHATHILRKIEERCDEGSPCQEVIDQLATTATSLRNNLPDELPFLSSSRGAPRRLRVAAVMREWLLTSPHPRRREHLQKFLSAYQVVSPLCLAEVRLLSLGVDLAVLDKCRMLPSVEKSPHRELLPRLITDLARTCRFIQRTDWKRLGEQVSQVHLLLTRDPSQLYPRLDIVSRDEYRQKVEQLSRLAQTGEAETAVQAVALAEKENTPVADFLLGPGKKSLVKKLAEENARVGTH